MRILDAYFADAGSVTGENAWEHVYRCLLWMNESAGLAHIYDSNHMQPGGVFHARALRFTEALCAHWGVDRAGLGQRIDKLFRGCVAELLRREAAAAETGNGIEAELESELIGGITRELLAAGVEESAAAPLARRIEGRARQFFTIGNKRKNALGEGFEDLLELLLHRVASIPSSQINTRTPVSQMPGFRRAPPRRPGSRSPREPRPDIAIVEGAITHVIATAKWSLRQDRETQLASEYQAFQMNKVQPTELRYALVTNEFDLARLRNVLDAMPGGVGGYIFHNVYHVCLRLLEQTHGTRFSELRPYVQTGKLGSLSDFLDDMRARFGTQLAS
jgi:hypothetical protein